jgi:hypothetical protein
MAWGKRGGARSGPAIAAMGAVHDADGRGNLLCNGNGNGYGETGVGFAVEGAP